jgi:hypothetical protein
MEAPPLSFATPPPSTDTQSNMLMGARTARRQRMRMTTARPAIRMKAKKKEGAYILRSPILAKKTFLCGDLWLMHVN